MTDVDEVQVCQPWPADTSCCPGWDEVDENLREQALKTASGLLWALSGRQYGQCPITIRPCLLDECGCAGPVPLRPSYGDWRGSHANWLNNACGRCGSGCSCTELCEALLPAVVGNIVEVKVDGHILAPKTAYKVLNGNRLIRTDDGCWPRCQDFTKSLDEQGTWGVTYVAGPGWPAGVEQAVGALACEIAKSCAGAPCRLPRSVETITRRGVQTTYLSLTELTRLRLTGLPEVDLWLRAVNPFGQVAPTLVWSPDIDDGTQITWGGP